MRSADAAALAAVRPLSRRRARDARGLHFAEGVRALARAFEDGAPIDTVIRSGVLLMGDEGRGLGDPERRLCTSLVRLPMSGCADSLNVGVAAGVLLYEAWRQLEGDRAGAAP